MHHGERQLSATPAVVRWAHRIVNGIFIAGILGLIALLVRAGFDAENPNDSVAWGLGLLFVYAMMAAGLLLVILLVHSVVARTLLYLKWPFVLFTLTYLVLTSSRDLVLPRLTGSDTVRLRVPSYAPELNPDEYLNVDLKLSVAKRAPARDRDALLRTATARLRSLQRRPEQVKKFFHHLRVRHAARYQLNYGPSNNYIGASSEPEIYLRTGPLDRILQAAAVRRVLRDPP